MTTKPNWVCTSCGMWSGRKDSVKRHITNQHDGISSIVSYIESVEILAFILQVHLLHIDAKL